MTKTNSNLNDFDSCSGGGEGGRALIYYNGEFIEADQLRLPHDDRGFLYGDGLFETLRAYQGKLFRAREHASRMLNSARDLGIATGFDAGALAAIFQETCRCNSGNMPGDLYLRATLTRGCGYGPDLNQDYSSNLLVYVKPLPEANPEVCRDGIAAIIASEKRAANSSLNRHKTTSYLECLLARREATRQGVAEAIFLDSEGYVYEGACSNLFMIKDGILITPLTSMNLLPGITRAVVLEIAEKCLIKAEEKSFGYDQLLQADEAFLTNSIQEILPLVEVGGIRIGDGKPGETTRCLQVAYGAEVQSSST